MVAYSQTLMYTGPQQLGDSCCTLDMIAQLSHLNEGGYGYSNDFFTKAVCRLRFHDMFLCFWPSQVKFWSSPLQNLVALHEPSNAFLFVDEF